MTADKIKVRGARVHNLKNIDVDVPLGKKVAIAGVSGSGKSSLALGVLYAEGSRRYLESLSTYTRRRMTTATHAQVDNVEHVPAAIALHQRPGVPNIRSTFGTATELLNHLRLMFSRLGSHLCPNGHRQQPSMDTARMTELHCPECGAVVELPGAESFAFNSDGACPYCEGTGVMRVPDESTYVSDPSLTIEQGAVAPWNTLMWSLMVDVCRAMGVRTDVPFRELSPEEKEIVFHGPMVKKHILYRPKNGEMATELDFTYYSAENTVLNALSKVKDEKGLARVARFLKTDVCPHCHGSRLNDKALSTLLCGKNLAEASAMTLAELITWVNTIPSQLPEEMRPMAKDMVGEFNGVAARLVELGLGYLSLDRSAATLSTGERQRVQFSRAVRNKTTGILYVLDEPSIGMHPANLKGLLGVMDDLVADGNSVVMVDHDTQVLRHADYMIELGPKAGKEGGNLIAEGSIAEIEANSDSKIGAYLSGEKEIRVREHAEDIFGNGRIRLSTNAIHTVQPLEVDIPKGRMTVVTGVSGSGKTTMVLECLLPALQARINGVTLPDSVRAVEAEGINRANLIDATPIGVNVRSTVATYADVHDYLRKIFAASPEAKALGYKAGDFSYNTGSLRCSECDGTGQISLDMQFLPDVEIVCPVCHGSRYSKEALSVHQHGFTLPQIMSMTVDEAVEQLTAFKGALPKLKTLQDLGLGYLTLGEATPALSGGEAQRLKLASEIGRRQDDAVFVFDEPTIGLHPSDVKVLLGVFQQLLDGGATVIVIEHDLDVIRNADYIIDMGPGGGYAGGRIVACGTPEAIASCPSSRTGEYLK